MSVNDLQMQEGFQGNLKTHPQTEFWGPHNPTRGYGTFKCGQLS